MWTRPTAPPGTKKKVLSVITESRTNKTTAGRRKSPGARASGFLSPHPVSLHLSLLHAAARVVCCILCVASVPCCAVKILVAVEYNASRMLLVVRCPLLAAHEMRQCRVFPVELACVGTLHASSCMSSAVCCTSSAICCLLHSARCLLVAILCAMSVACCPLLAACCTRSVVCCCVRCMMHAAIMHAA